MADSSNDNNPKHTNFVKFINLVKYLLTTLTLSSLFFTIPPSIATRQSSIYLPIDKTCAVYKGKIDHAQAFPLWIEKNRQLMIETNSELKIAVSFKNAIVSPYQVHSPTSAITSQYSYLTASTGNHVISVEGKAQEATITFCLD